MNQTYEEKLAYNRAYRLTQHGRYNQQKGRAIERGIEWRFTFDTWVALWGVRYKMRGLAIGGLVMSRYNDVGPYAPGNCKIVTTGENTREGLRLRAA